jgi:hypothetical protein
MANKGTFRKGDPRAGRKPGVPNKLTADVREMILKALEGAGGVEYLKARAKDTPGPFLALVGKVLPLQVQGDPNQPVMPGSVLFVISQQPGAVNKT